MSLPTTPRAVWEQSLPGLAILDRAIEDARSKGDAPRLAILLPWRDEYVRAAGRLAWMLGGPAVDSGQIH